VRGTDVVTASHDEECDDEQTSKTGDRLRPFQVVHVAASLFSVRDGVEGLANRVPHVRLNQLWSFTYDGSTGASALASSDGASRPQVW